MKDFTDLCFTVIILICLIACYHRLSILSHRIDMVIIVQQSQQQCIDKFIENKDK